MQRPVRRYQSFDPEFIASHHKRQNVSGASSLLDDLAYAESLGIMVTYGYLFDPRMTEIAQMDASCARY